MWSPYLKSVILSDQKVVDRAYGAYSDKRGSDVWIASNLILASELQPVAISTIGSEEVLEGAELWKLGVAERHILNDSLISIVRNNWGGLDEAGCLNSVFKWQSWISFEAITTTSTEFILQCDGEEEESKD